MQRRFSSAVRCMRDLIRQGYLGSARLAKKVGGRSVLAEGVVERRLRDADASSTAVRKRVDTAEDATPALALQDSEAQRRDLDSVVQCKQPGVVHGRINTFRACRVSISR
jgi:hypothetical protein